MLLEQPSEVVALAGVLPLDRSELEQPMLWPGGQAGSKQKMSRRYAHGSTSQSRALASSDVMVALTAPGLDGVLMVPRPPLFGSTAFFSD
jgi:hypothetical protein